NREALGRARLETEQRLVEPGRVGLRAELDGDGVMVVQVVAAALPLEIDRHVADVGRVDRLHAALAQRVVDGAGNELVRDIVENLILVALLDHARWRLAGPEAGNARLPGIVPGDALD